MLRVFQRLLLYVGKLLPKDHLPIIKEEEIDFLAIYQVLYRGRWLIGGVAFSSAFIAIIVALMLTPLFRASTSIYPFSSSSLSPNLAALAGLAATLGTDLGAGGSTVHIPDIVESRWVRADLVHNKWRTRKYAEPVDLITYWELDGAGSWGISLNPLTWIKRSPRSDLELEDGSAVVVEEEALEAISNRISVSASPTGLVKIDVWMEEPQLAADIANKIHDLVVDYAVTTASEFARLNRQFIDERKEVVTAELHQAEADLTAFRRQNRNVTNSPDLMMELERLMREVEIRTQVYITLEQQHELASIEEARETPSVAILDTAQPAAKKDRPRRRRIVTVSLLLGGIAGLVLTFLDNAAIGLFRRQ